MKVELTARERGMADAIRQLVDEAKAELRAENAALRSSFETVLRSDAARIAGLSQEVASLRADVASLRSALAAGDGNAEALLAAVAVERAALDDLAEQLHRLTHGEVQARLSAMRRRLWELDQGVPH